MSAALSARRDLEDTVPTLEERIVDAAALSGGTMPIAVVVADDQRDRAEAHLAGIGRRGRQVEILTRSEYEAGRKPAATRGADRFDGRGPATPLEGVAPGHALVAGTGSERVAADA